MEDDVPLTGQIISCNVSSTSSSTTVCGALWIKITDISSRMPDHCTTPTWLLANVLVKKCPQRTIHMRVNFYLFLMGCKYSPCNTHQGNNIAKLRQLQSLSYVLLLVNEALGKQSFVSDIWFELHTVSVLGIPWLSPFTVHLLHGLKTTNLTIHVLSAECELQWSEHVAVWPGAILPLPGWKELTPALNPRYWNYRSTEYVHHRMQIW